MLTPIPIYPTLPPWSAVVGFVLGALAGSFLNMLIWRLPRGKSLVDPAHSICPLCNHQLTPLDLMPIVSWLRTGGKCRHCGAPIAVRYLLVEVLVGALFTIIWLQTMTVAIDPHWGDFFAYAAAAAILVAIVFIDWELYIIPDELNAALLVVGLVYGASHGAIGESIKGAFLGWALIWGFVLLGRLAFGKDAMGDGDIKMMRGVGALLGPTLLVANVGIGVVLGLVGGIVGLAIEARRGQRNKEQEEGSSEQGAGAEDASFEATPIPLVLLSGALYLLCIDIVALFVPPLNRWIVSRYPAEVLDDNDDWEPSATAIPFGPYLAAGALICMLAGEPIHQFLKSYWDNATGATPRAALEHSGRTPRWLVEGGQTPFYVEQRARIGSLLPRDGQVIECL
jgi:leader peptidase (prepilin peptidase)/N-methyltransferase